MKLYNNPFKWHTIAKYNPDNRGNIYDEWTSISDIGETFGFKTLTMAEYMEVETNYVKTILEILHKIGCKYLTVVRKEACFDEMFYSNLLFEGDMIFIENLSAGNRVSARMMESVIRASLREWCYFKLTNSAKCFSIDFGYDYYVHIFTHLDTHVLKTVAEKNHLYLFS